MATKSRFDLLITDPSTGTEIGFNALREKGIPSYREYDGKTLVDLFSTGTPTQVDTNPEEELILGQSTHHAGFGEEYFNPKDPKRYFNSHGMDLSIEGNAMLSWGATGITLTSYPANFTVVNGDMELTTGWTGGTGRSNTHAHGGTYSWEVNNTTAYQDLLTWNSKYRNTYVKVTGWIYGNGAATSHIDINDGVGTTASSNVSAAAWTSVTVTRRLDAAATKFRINLVEGGGGGAAWFDDVTVTYYALSGTTTTQAIFNDIQYINSGNVLMKLNGTGAGFDTVTSLSANITDLVPFQVSGTDYLLCFVGTSTNYWYMTTAEAFTESNAANPNYQFGAWVNTTVDTVYANDGVNTVRSTVNPLNGGTAWSAQTVVGAASDAITALREKSGALLIDKEDMPYYLNSAGAVQKDLAPECVSGKATHSGKNSTTWQGEYWRPTGDQALLRSGKYDDGSIGYNQWVQPAKYTANNPDFSGQVEAVAGDEEWLYCALDNGTKVEILKGRDEDIDGDRRFLWHTYQEITLTGVETMWVSTVFQKRLWISSTTASEQIFYIPLPTEYADLTSDANKSFLTGGKFETSWLHGSFPNDNKLGVNLTCTMGHTYDADIYFNVNYKELGDSSWSSTTYKFDGSATSMTETQFISTAGTTVVSPMYKLQFTGVTDDTAKTPILLNYKLKTILQANPRRILLIKVKVSKIQSDAQGLIGGANFELQKSCLSNAKATSNLITIKEYLTDKDGVTRYCKLLPLPSNLPWVEPYNDSMQNEQRKDPELLYNLLLLDIPLS